MQLGNKTMIRNGTALVSAMLIMNSLLPVACMTTYAAVSAPKLGPQTDVNGLTGTITVKNASDASKVNAYQIVDGQYNDGKFIQYVQTITADGYDISDITAPTSEEITTIANAIGDKTLNLTAIPLTKSDAGEWAANVEPGEYIIIATKGTDADEESIVYNPAIVSVNITDTDTPGTGLENGSIDMTYRFNAGDTAYLKKSSSDMDKKITGNKDKNGTAKNVGTLAIHSDAKNGDIVAYGDTVEFTINSMTIPSFSDDYASPKYEITDVLDADTFENISTPVVSVGGTELTNTNGTLSVTNVDSTTTTAATLTTNAESNGKFGFTVDFDSTYLKSLSGTNVDASTERTAYDTAKAAYEALFTDATELAKTDDEKAADLAKAKKTMEDAKTAYDAKINTLNAANRAVVITYNVKIKDTAPVNFAEGHNRATLNYSNNPDDATSYKTINKDTYNYTFAIDADIDGPESETDKKSKTGQDTTQTYEFNKVTVAGQTYTEATETSKTSTWTTNWTTSTQKSPKALEGATFSIYSDTAFTTKAAADATSDSNGHCQWKGLDEGSYYIKETGAASGYSLNPAIYRVDITATLDDTTGVLTGYDMHYYDVTSATDKASDKTSEVGHAKYTGTPTIATDGSVTYVKGDGTTTITKDITPTEVVNTRLVTLPSTGGNGIIILEIIAGAFGIGLILFTIGSDDKKKKETD